ncbi:PRR11 protein, partial [Polypterus senegalus]|nr:proline-rich protein 11 isoform X1 [Polypterus senegalus]MBN3293927.1 PRR11 protein [Polypterus senegalus]
MGKPKEHRRRWKSNSRRRAREQRRKAENVSVTSDYCPVETPTERSLIVQVPAVAERNFLSPLLLVMASVYCSLRNTLSRVYSCVWNAFFPSIYLKQLHAVREQVDQLQMEMAALRCAIRLSEAMNSSCQTPTAPLNPSPVIQLNSASTNVPVVPALPPVPPPPVPPPPPPPPPVPPPPQTSVFTEKKNMVKRHPENCKLQQNPLVKKDAPVSVTLQDLLNVKLRKTDSPTTKVKAFSPSKRRIPLITMSDLQKVTLRSSQSDIPNKFGKTHLNRNTCPSPVNLRRQLKRVDVQRSPGGTPLYEKENKESGSGLTPIMTQALRRKFQMALPRSPPPLIRSCNTFNTSFSETN